MAQRGAGHPWCRRSCVPINYYSSLSVYSTGISCMAFHKSHSVSEPLLIQELARLSWVPSRVLSNSKCQNPTVHRKSRSATPPTLGSSGSQLKEHKFLILITHQFHICKFTYWLQFICNPQINTYCVLMVVQAYEESNKKFGSPAITFPAEVK